MKLLKITVLWDPNEHIIKWWFMINSSYDLAYGMTQWKWDVLTLKITIKYCRQVGGWKKEKVHFIYFFVMSLGEKMAKEDVMG